MLLWQDKEVDTSGELGPADRLSTGIGSGDGKNVIPKLMDPTLPIARQGIQFYTDLSDVVNQIDASIVTVDNAMQSIINTMGQGENLAAGIKKNFAEASLEIIKMGGTEKEALAVQTETLEVLGRNTTLSKEQYETLFATSKVTGQSVKDLATSLLDVGGNIDQIATDMEAVVSRANALGVNAKAVSEKVVENMEQMNRFGFQGGIDGLARMAAKAQVLRFDMGEVFELAEDLLSPEKAIELASSLQRLGATTTSLIDPLRLMDLAQNDVGELQNQLGELFKTYTYFDEETKKFQIMPSARRDLRQLSQELGIPLKEIEKMALGAADLDKKMSQIDFSGLDVTDDTKELVANLATMNKEGKYTIRNEAGVDEDLSTFIDSYKGREDELTNFLQQQEDDSQKTDAQKMLERADAQLSHLKKIEQSNEATAKALSLGIGGSEYATQLLDAQVAINKKLNAQVTGTEGYQDPQFLKDLQDAGLNMKKASELLSQGNFKDGIAGVISSTKEFGKTVLNQTKDIVVNAFKDIKDLGIKADLGTDFSKSLLDALKYFENPGTLKVTVYGDKTDNTNKIEKAITEPSQIDQESDENQNKLFDVSLSQLEQTINLVSLMEKMVQQSQSVNSESLKETIREMAEKQIEKNQENYTQTKTGTFFSKETDEEKTILEMTQMDKNLSQDYLGEFLEKQNNMLSSMKNYFENENTKVVNGTSNNVVLNEGIKTEIGQSVITYLSQKTEPVENKTLPEITKILTQNNDTVVQKLSDVESVNKETLLGSTELNNTLNTQIKSQDEKTDSFTKTVDTIIKNDKDSLRLIENKTETVTGNLIEQVQVPEIVQTQIPTFNPIENVNLEKYLERVEKTTIEKNNKIEQTVKFDSTLPIKIEVTGIPQNNPAATEAFLTAINRDRRFAIAIEKAVTGRNFNLVEKLV